MYFFCNLPLKRFYSWAADVVEFDQLHIVCTTVQTWAGHFRPRVRSLHIKDQPIFLAHIEFCTNDGHLMVPLHLLLKWKQLSVFKIHFNNIFSHKPGNRTSMTSLNWCNSGLSSSSLDFSSFPSPCDSPESGRGGTKLPSSSYWPRNEEIINFCSYSA